MPIVTVTLIEGYQDDVRTRLSERLTDTVRETIGAVNDGVTVVLNEVSAASYMRGRTGKTPGVAPQSPTETVRAFLDAMGTRDFDAARGFLGSRFSMMFPGGVRMRRLEDVQDWAAGRYRSASKTYQRFDEAFAEDGTIVYCYGTLSGVWLSGGAFAGIRFVDRFRLVDGLLAEQDVWNDVGEFRAAGLAG